MNIRRGMENRRKSMTSIDIRTQNIQNEILFEKLSSTLGTEKSLLNIKALQECVFLLYSISNLEKKEKKILKTSQLHK
jgi:NADH dehydrogenase FAD-containing subunit